MEQVLLFRLGTHPYALEVSHIQEIVEAPPLYFIPGAPAVYPGAMNFHGNVVPVLDLGAFLQLDGGEEEQRVLVLSPPLCPLGLLVAGVRRIVNRDPAEQRPYRETGEKELFIRFRFELEGEEINMLDIGQLIARLETAA
ncbi:MAG: chemotaxis protein CheW [Desulfuromonadales bacterium]|nr:chemotaxis protein CheW [Desulfuromonadales bacterium]